MNDDTSMRVLNVIDDICSQRPAPDTKLKDLPMDSIDRVDMVMRIETDFNIVIDDDEAEAFKTVHDVVQCVRSCLEKQKHK